VLGLADFCRLFGRVVLVSFLCLGGIPSASAQTAISGSLSSDTRWTLAGGPYVLTGTVTVNSGVALTIDSGVVIYMTPAAELSVRGTLKAQGTAAAPIKVLSDKVRQGLPAVPGDWKRWVFEVGSSDQTRLDYVTFENGSGLSVFGSAPVFNNLDIRNHAAPAISIDLAASPSGVGNKASGNTLNGIAVPPGDISSTVKWGLRGIPYLVSGAGVGIGAPPLLATVAPNNLEQGDKVLVALSGTRLTGLSEVAFEPAGIETSVQTSNATSANVSLTVPASAPTGAITLRAWTDAGKVELPAAVTVAAMKAPVVSSMTPRAVNRGKETSILLTGTSLSAASVTTNANGLSVVSPVSEKTSVAFRLSVASTVAPGAYPLNVTNLVGSFPLTVEIIPDLPSQSTYQMVPAFIVLPVDTTKFRQVMFRAPQSSNTERRFALSVADPTVVGISVSEIVLPAGQYEAIVLLKGLRVGATTIIVSGADMTVPLEVPANVTTSSINQVQTSPQVGVVKGDGWNNTAGNFVSKPIGVEKGGQIHSYRGDAMSLPVGVVKVP
jgi:hypothetical protein